jgi:hypothetical protein
MGYNTKHFDHEAHYASKSTKELEALLKKAQEFVEKYPQFEYSWHNDYIHQLKLRIAERIGKKK